MSYNKEYLELLEEIGYQLSTVQDGIINHYDFHQAIEDIYYHYINEKS